MRSVLLAALLASSALPAQQPAPASLVRAGVTEKLTHHVWAIPDGSASLVPNVGIVVGDQAVLVIDTGMGTRNAQTVLEEVAKVGAGKPIYIVTTHVHPEHDMGAHAFPKDSRLIRSQDQVADIAAGAGTSLVPITHWLSSLDALEALRPKRIVPSHGPFGGEELIEGYRAYLERIRARTAELKKAGKSLEETIQAISAEMSSQNPDPFRLASAIRAGYNEAS